MANRSLMDHAAADAAVHPGSTAIEVRELSIAYRGAAARGVAPSYAVESVDCQVSTGEFVALIGPSGCGKSTLLKAIAGLIPVTSGAVTIAAGEGPAKIGFLFQSDALLPWRTAQENVELGYRLSTPHSKRKDAQERVRELLSELGLDDAADKYPGQLSGGMRKRVALARTLAYEPSVFLMDEPFSALDAQTRIQVGNLFLNVLEEAHQTVLFVTHDIEEAVALADRVLVMTRGPGRIATSIPVKIPRPRDYHQTRFTPDFGDIQQQVWDALHMSHGGSSG